MLSTTINFPESHNFLWRRMPLTDFDLKKKGDKSRVILIPLFFRFTIDTQVSCIFSIIYLSSLLFMQFTMEIKDLREVGAIEL